MARFPVRESDLIVLAHQMIAGFNNNPAVFPHLPIPVEQLQTLLDGFLADVDAANRADSQAADAHTQKDGSQQSLKDAMTTALRYAEITAANPDQLGLIGWSGPRPAASLQAPGQPRVLEAGRQGAGWVFLDWKEPTDGGKVAAYHIQRRELPDGPWQTVGLAVVSEAMVSNQPVGKTLEYRVYGVNKAGDGPVSNLAEVVL